jgi:hypothetical protein
LTRRTCPISGLAAKRQAFRVKRRPGCLNSSSLARSAPFRKDYPLIVGSSTEKARLFERLGSWGSGRHLPGFLKGINRSRVQAAAVDRQIGCDGHDMNAIAPGAVECADIEAGWSPGNTRQTHPCIAFCATRSLTGDERVAERGTGFRHQPSDVWASNQPLFRRSVRSDAAVCRSWFRLGPVGRDLARRRTSRRFSTRFASL